MKAAIRFVSLALASLTATAAHAELKWAPATIPRPLAWTTDDTVSVVKIHDGVLYVGGQFDHVGRLTGAFGVADRATGDVETQRPVTDGAVFALESDGQGGWFLGGTFTHVGADARQGFAHVLADGTLSDFAPTFAGAVRCIRRDGMTLYVGGEFSGVNGVTHRRLAKFDLSTGTQLPWNPMASGTFSSSDGVNAILVVGSTVYVGGQFNTFVGGQSRRHLAALDAATGMALLFDPNPDKVVSDLAMHSSGLVVAGNFAIIGGQLRGRLAVVDPILGVATPFDVPASSTVFCVALDGDTLYCGGLFTTFGGLPRSRAAAVDVATAMVLPWDPNADGPSGLVVQDVTTTATSVLLGGQFTSIGGTPRSGFAEVTRDTGAPTALTIDAGGPGQPRVDAVRADASRVYVGGEFRLLGVQVRRGFAAFDATTEALLPLAPTFLDLNFDEAANVQQLAFGSGVVFAGGTFSRVNGQLHPRLAKIDLATGALDAQFAPGFLFNAGTPGELLLVGDTLILGRADVASGGPVEGLRAVGTTLGDLKWNVHTNSQVRSIALSDDGSRLFVGGDFVQAEVAPDVFEPRLHLFAVDPATGAIDPSWMPAANNSVRLVRTYDDHVYVDGSYTTIDGHFKLGLAKLHASDGQLVTWGAKQTDDANELIFRADTVVATCGFEVPGQPIPSQLGIIDSFSSIPTSWPVQASGVASIDLLGGRLFCGGNTESKYSGELVGALHVFDLFPLWADIHDASLSGGQHQSLTLDAGAARAGKGYWTLGSISGSFPGWPLAPEVFVPLNFDGYFLSSLFNPPATPIGAPFGFLDADGRAFPSVTLPPGLNPVFVGFTLKHACIVFDPGSLEPLLVTNPAELRLHP